MTNEAQTERHDDDTILSLKEEAARASAASGGRLSPPQAEFLSICWLATDVPRHIPWASVRGLILRGLVKAVPRPGGGEHYRITDSGEALWREVTATWCG